MTVSGPDPAWHIVAGGLDNIEAGGCAVITDGNGMFGRIDAYGIVRADSAGEPIAGTLPDRLRLRVDPDSDGVFVLHPNRRPR